MSAVRLFVAVWPPNDVVERLRDLDRPPFDRVRWTSADQWHVTLRFYGDLPSATAITERLRAAPLPRAEAVMGPVSARVSPVLLWLPVAGLDALAAAVAKATDGLGPPPEGPFRGHLTLARARRGAARSILRSLAGRECAGRWPVEEVTVVSSTLGGTGSRYEVVDRVVLEPNARST